MEEQEGDDKPGVPMIKPTKTMFEKAGKAEERRANLIIGDFEVKQVKKPGGLVKGKKK